MRESISEKCGKIVDIPVYVMQRQPGGKRGEPQRYRVIALSVSRALRTFFVLVIKVFWSDPDPHLDPIFPEGRIRIQVD